MPASKPVRPSILDTPRGQQIARLYPRVTTMRAAPYSAPADIETMSTKPGAKHQDSADLFAAAWLQMERMDGHANHLPLMRPQREVCVLWPVYGSRTDFFWPVYDLIVECDGGQNRFGGGSHNTDDDKDRSNMLVLMGYRVLRFSAKQLKTNPHGCVATALAMMGYELLT